MRRMCKINRPLVAVWKREGQRCRRQESGGERRDMMEMGRAGPGVGKRFTQRSGPPSSGPLSSGVSFEVITGTLGPREGMG